MCARACHLQGDDEAEQADEQGAGEDDPAAGEVSGVEDGASIYCVCMLVCVVGGRLPNGSVKPRPR